MMKGVMAACLVSLAVLGSGCSVFKGLMDSATPYSVSLSTTGVISIPDTKIGEVKLPAGSVDIASLGFGLASGFLASQHGVKECQFAPVATPPDAPKGALVIGASANCKLNGQQVVESITITFVPA